MQRLAKLRRIDLEQRKLIIIRRRGGIALRPLSNLVILACGEISAPDRERAPRKPFTRGEKIRLELYGTRQRGVPTCDVAELQGQLADFEIMKCVRGLQTCSVLIRVTRSQPSALAARGAVGKRGAASDLDHAKQRVQPAVKRV